MEVNEEFRGETEEEALQFFANLNFVHFIGMFAPPRPGVKLCFVKLEHTHFPPGTDANKDLFFRLRQWQGIIWAIISIPRAKMNLMKQVAAETGLRIADGVPHMITRGKVKEFPINNERVFTLENASGHPVYRNDPEEIEELLRQERQQIKEIFDKADQCQKEENSS